MVGDFMIGSPEETREEILQTIDFATKIGLDYATFYITQILPGTALYKRALEEKIIETDYWREYVLNPTYPLKRAYWLGKFSIEELEALARYGYKKFYLRPKYILQRIKKIKTLLQAFNQIKAAIKTFITPNICLKS